MSDKKEMTVEEKKAASLAKKRATIAAKKAAIATEAEVAALTVEEVAELPMITYRGNEVSNIKMATRPEGYVEVAYRSAGSIKETNVMSQAEFKREFGFDAPVEIL